MKKQSSRLWKRVLWAAGGILLLLIVSVVYLVVKDPNPSRPRSIDDPNGFVQAAGTNLYDGEGKLLTLRGVNLGDWFLPENYMAAACVDGAESMKFTLRSAREAMEANPNLADEQIVELYHLYMETFITEEDFAAIASLGLNTVRIPFSWMNLTTEDGELLENGIAYLDRALEFYKALHNLKGNRTPVYIGEWNAFADPADWHASLDLFEELGWSWTSWTYKANGRIYNHAERWNGPRPRLDTWGVYELDLEPVELTTASYEEIAETYRRTATEYAAPSLVYEVYSNRFGSGN